MNAKRLLSYLSILAVAGILVALMVSTLGTDSESLPPAPPVAPDVADGGGVSGPRPGRGSRWAGSGGGTDSGDVSRGRQARGAVVGSVREAGSGFPVPGAEVLCWEGTFRATDTTDANGDFRLGGVPAGGVRVRVFTSEFVDPPPRGVAVPAGGSATVRFDVESGRAVAGRVTDRETGEALAGAEVAVLGTSRKKVTTGPDGIYRLAGLPVGRTLLTARAERYPQERIQVETPAEGGDVELDIQLGRGASVRGVVTDPTGKSVPGAKVSLRGFPPETTESGPDGSFELISVPVDRTVWIQAEKEGFVPARSDALQFKSGESYADLRLVLETGGEVRGTVQFENGNPAEGATVWIVPRPPGLLRGAPPRATTDDEGRFRLTPVSAGDHQIVANHPDGLEVRQELDGVREGEAVEVALVLGAGRRIMGTVKDDSGRLLSGILVMARPLEPGPGMRWGNARTGEDGKFSISGLAGGTFEVTARPVRGGRSARAESVPAGTLDLVLTLPAPGSISGIVTFPSGDPVRSFTLRARPADPRTGGGMVFERVNTSDGRFRVAEVAPGTYTLTVTASGGYSRPLPDLVVTSGEELSGLRIVLEPPGYIRGTIYREDGSRAAGARVTASGEDVARGVGGSSARTDENGEYRLEGLRPGRYRVVAMAGGLVASRDGIEVSAGLDSLVDLTMPLTGRLVVRVVTESGEPVEGAGVQLRNSDGAWVPAPTPVLPDDLPPDRRVEERRAALRASVQTDESGACVREGVPEGSISIQVRAKGYEPGASQVQVRAGRTTEVRVTLRPGEDSTLRPPRRRGDR